MSKTLSPTLTKETIQYFWRHAWRYKALVLGTLISVPLALLLLTFIPPLIISSILQHLSTNVGHGAFWHSFGTSILWYSIISIIGGVFMWRVAVFFIWKLEIYVLRDIHREVFDHLISLSINFHANRFGGSLVSQANKLASAYVRFSDTTLFESLTLLLSFTFSFAILLPKVPWIAILLIFFSVLFMMGASRLTKVVRVLRTQEAAAENTQTGFLADAITNILVVKSFAAGKHEKERYAAATADTAAATHRVMYSSMKRDTIFGSGTVSIGIITLILALASATTLHTNLGTTYLVISYSSIISQRLWEFAQHILRDYNRAFGDAREMIEILRISPEVQDSDHPEPSQITEGAIQFKDVTFAHPDTAAEEALFSHLSLDIAAGEKVGLVGHSGSGKTTLTKLLLRFHDIDKGAILIDQQDIATITQDDLRESIAYVPQEPLLFHRSIAENIRYGRPDASLDAVIEAAKQAHAHEFITKLSGKYDTLVGERGVKLSGGQRQRIAIARAILKDAPILVLDEATSALDSESEQLIQDALWKLMENRTAIVIAHRLSTIQRMDRIIVLSNGTITEQGSHTSLLKRNGTYAKLWKHQSGGFINE